MMNYILEEKNIAMLSDGTVVLNDDDSVTIFVKDMAKPIFSANDMTTLMCIGNRLEFIPAATREEMVFTVGGKVYSGCQCTLIQLDIPIPGVFASQVKQITKTTKKPTTRRNTGATRRSTKASTVMPTVTPIPNDSKLTDIPPEKQSDNKSEAADDSAAGHISTKSEE